MTLSRMMASLLLMTLAAWLLLACVSPASTSPAGERKTHKFHPKCPPEDGPVPVYIADPKDCQAFYRCNDGHAVKLSSPHGLYFNAEQQVCDYPGHGSC